MDTFATHGRRVGYIEAHNKLLNDREKEVL
jgi:hypothetical protein